MDEKLAQPQISGSLGEPARALDAVRNLQTGMRNTGALRSMFGIFTTDADSATTLVTNARDNTQRAKPKIAPSMPKI